MKKKNFNIRKAFILLLFLLFVFILNFTVFPTNIKNFFFSVSSPVQKIFWQANINVSDFFNGNFKANSIIEENKKLKIKNQELVSQIVSLKETEKENEFLKKSLELDLENDFQLILAQVTSKDIFQDSILINKGKKDGVKENLPVITGQKVLLGRIGQVYDNFSEVILITNKRSSFDAKIAGQDIYGIVRGKGGFNLYFDLIPKQEEVFENDIVVTSVLGGIYPANFLVGQIKTIKKSDLEPFQEAELIMFFDIRMQNYLFVIKDF